MLSDAQLVIECCPALLPRFLCQAARLLHHGLPLTLYLGVSPDASELYAPRIVPGRRGLSQIAKQRTSQILAETACARYG